MDSPYRLILCTCPDQATASRIAEALVAERLAACVNIVPGLTSIYRWRGTIERDQENLLLIKTLAKRAPALGARILALHPYDTPELIELSIDDGAAPYLAWIASCVE